MYTFHLSIFGKFSKSKKMIISDLIKMEYHINAKRLLRFSAFVSNRTNFPKKVTVNIDKITMQNDTCLHVINKEYGDERLRNFALAMIHAHANDKNPIARSAQAVIVLMTIIDNKLLVPNLKHSQTTSELFSDALETLEMCFPKLHTTFVTVDKITKRPIWVGVLAVLTVLNIFVSIILALVISYFGCLH